MSGTCPRLIIAGTGSGVGKTSLTLAIVRELTRRGLRVQTFKVGPDFLDPTYLALACGRTCYNLDGWMTSREYVCGLLARASAEADIAIIEGVMGMFDGASPQSLQGSTAEIAQWTGTPVVLVVYAYGAARSLAATVHGFAYFEPGVGVAGVIANHSGSRGHRDLLAESLAAAGLPPLVGAMPRGALPALASRHLGLVTATPQGLDLATLDRLADACAEHLDVPMLLNLANSARAPLAVAPRANEETRRNVRLGIARDAAFHFYYPDNLEALKQRGAELIEFSPLSDKALPERLDGLYFGGGYPELYAAELAENHAMLDAVRRLAAAGRPIYGECGGLMYLGRRLKTRDDHCYPLAGIVPVDTAMLPSLSSLGYVEVTTAADGLWGPAGTVCRGHEFHYSRIETDDSAAAGWQSAYTLSRRRGDAVRAEGFAKGSILASYVHLHWASRPAAFEHFLACCER